MYNKLIGRPVIYNDYLGFKQYGQIVFIEPYPNDPELAYLYIQNEIVDENTHHLETANGIISYADIRVSSDVYLDEK